MQAWKKHVKQLHKKSRRLHALAMIEFHYTKVHCGVLPNESIKRPCQSFQLCVWSRKA